MGQVAAGMRIHGCRRMTWEEHTSYDIAPLPIMGKHGFINVLESNPTRSAFLLGSLRLTCHKVPASPHLKWLLETFLPATITYHVSQRLILALGPSSHFLPCLQGPVWFGLFPAIQPELFPFSPHTLCSSHMAICSLFNPFCLFFLLSGLCYSSVCLLFFPLSDLSPDLSGLYWSQRCFPWLFWWCPSAPHHPIN